MKSILNLFIILSFTNLNIFCHCFEKNENSVNEMYKNYELIVIAEPIENIHINKEVAGIFDSRKRGTEVRMKIKEIIKGKISTSHIITYQLDGGNCSNTFEFENNYVIFGNQIKSFEKSNRKKNSVIKKNGEELQLPDSELKEKTLIIYNGDSIFINFWNKQAKKETIINTNMCTSGIENGKLHKILKEIKK